MGKSKFRNSIIFFLLLVTIMNGMVSRAAGDLDGKIVDGSLLTSESEASDTKELVPEETPEILPYGVYLSNGISTIVDKGNGVVYVCAETFCNKISDEVYGKVYLERLTNSGWSTIKTHSNTSYNTNYVSAGMSFSVAKGYYYRVRGYHYAKKGSQLESTSTCTSGIYIS